MLINYDYKGNVRELRNIAERIAVMCEEKQIDEQLIETALYPEDILSSHRNLHDRAIPEKNPVSVEEEENIERNSILEALQKSGGRKGTAAEILGMDRSTLWRKMKYYKIK